MIGFIDSIKSFYRQYANFSGRATRAEYWWIALYMFIFISIPSYINVGVTVVNGEPNLGLQIWVGLFSLANIIPALAIAWRRLHDIGKGGGWFFINFVPIVGNIWYLVLMLTPSEQYPNRFGNPVEDDAARVKY
ncbi:MAG: DUF805 domain-containing protein [Muribaculaceae bacterium]|nr:DUF805 domain-containing protein [Muribaculaceae bacterium]